MIDFAAASESISQVEAWRLWFENVDISTKAIMFDISIRNWGRIGKSIQALAALAILLDIIGAPAVRRFGSSLRNVITLGRARYLAVVSLQLVGDGIFPKNAVLFRLRHVVHHGGKVGVLLVNCCNPRVKHQERKVLVSRLLRRNLPILLGSNKGVRRPFLAFAVDILFVEPTAWIIGHPKNENLIKGLSIVVFLIGFYFDLLAS